MFERFNSRSTELERLDTGAFTPAEYQKWQREMWYIHRFFGEVRAMRRTVLAEIAAANTESVSILDVGAGDGGLIAELRDSSGGNAVRALGVEMNHEAALSIKSNGVTAVEADAMQLPFADETFDVSMCSLVVHHLDPENAIRLLSEMARVARRIFAIDLNREPLPYYLYRAFAPIFLQRFTVEDGALSILRAYQPDELTELATKAGLRDIKIVKSRLNRLVLSANR